MGWTERQFEQSYTNHYEHHEFDSASFQREFLAGKLGEEVNGGGGICLDLGSGRGALKKEIANSFNLRRKLSGLRVNSLDIATLGGCEFVGEVSTHVQGSGRKLPYQGESLDYIWSNMAMDLMPRSVFDEVFRVLKSGGVLVANLHHPKLTKISDSTYRDAKTRLNRAYYNYDRYGGRKNSRKVEREKLVVESIEFRREVLPELVFRSRMELSRFMQNGNWRNVSVVEQGKGNEEWYFLRAEK